MPIKEVNGINTAALFQTIDAVKTNPGLAKFRFRLNNQWIDGPRNRSTIKEFHGVGQDHQHARPFTLDADEPPVLLGHDLAPNAGEYLLAALTACVSSTLVYHAAARGIVIQDMEVQVEGDIDLRGFLGIDKSVRNGFQNIRMTFSILADVNDKQLEELVQLGPDFSPVLDSLTKGVPVTVQAQRMSKEKASGAA